MPNAVITTQTFVGDGSQLSLINAISTAMTTAGFSLLDSFINVGEYRVWNFLDGSTNLILELGFTNTTTSCTFKGYSAFDTTTNTGSNPSTTSVDNIFSLSATYTFHICNHPEYRGIMLYEGVSAKIFIGYVRPKPTLAANTYWNDAVFPLAWIIRSASTDLTDSSCLQPISSVQPSGISTTNSLTVIACPNGNYLNSNSAVIHPCTIVSSSADILVFTSDIGLAGASAYSLGDTINGDYQFFSSSRSSECKVFIRIANSEVA